MHKAGGGMPRRVAIVGGGVSGLGAARALNQHPDRFDFRLFEAEDQLGGKSITVDMPQADSTTIPFDISVTACIPSVYHHFVLFMQQHGIELTDTRFSYSVKSRGRIYAHDFDSDLRAQVATRNLEVPETAGTYEVVRPAQPFPVQVGQLT